MQNDLIAILPELVLAISSMLLLLVGVFAKNSSGNLLVISRSSAFALVLALGSIIFLQRNILDASVFNNLVIVDSFAIFTKTVVIFSAVIVLLISQKFLEE